jgi:glycine cleavage system H protein
VAEASYPDDLKYHSEHDWARIEGDQATLGITWYAQDSLGEVVYFSPTAAGEEISKDGEYGELESTKAVSTLIAPLSGEVIETNDALDGNESTVNDDPYGEGWLIKVRLSDPSEVDTLMDADAYQAFVDAL